MTDVCLKVDEETKRRFWSRVRIDPSGCLLWTGAKVNGLGLFRYGSQRIGAHRFSYQLLVGPIPDGLTLDHMCHNGSGCPGGNTCPHRACVHPDHLEPATTWENTRRGEAITAKNARKTHCKRNHPFDEQNTYHPPGGGRSCRACHREDAWKWNSVRATTTEGRRRGFRRPGLAG